MAFVASTIGASTSLCSSGTVLHSLLLTIALLLFSRLHPGDHVAFLATSVVQVLFSSYVRRTCLYIFLFFHSRLCCKFSQPNAQAKFPLRAGAWCAIKADAQDPRLMGWLQASGFDPAAVTVWVAEGLLVYLDPEVVPVLLKVRAQRRFEGKCSQ